MLLCPRQLQPLWWLVLDNLNLQPGQSWVTSSVSVAGRGQPQPPFGLAPNGLSPHFGLSWTTQVPFWPAPNNHHYYILSSKPPHSCLESSLLLHRYSLFLFLQPDVHFFPQGLNHLNPKSGQPPPSIPHGAKFPVF